MVIGDSLPPLLWPVFLGAVVTLSQQSSVTDAYPTDPSEHKQAPCDEGCRERLKEERVKKIKTDILKSLFPDGSMPNMTGVARPYDYTLVENANFTLPTPNKKQTDEILSRPEEDMNCTHGVLRYHLAMNRGDKIRVTNAHIIMRILRKKSRSKKRKAKKSKSRVTLSLYHVDDQGEKAFANWDIKVDRTKWHELKLPPLIIQKAIDSKDKVLKLRVVCENCDKRTKPVLCETSKKKPSRGRRAPTKSKKRGNKKRNRKSKSSSVSQAAKESMKSQTSRPFLIIRAKRTSRSRSLKKRDTRDVCENGGNQACRKTPLYVDFRAQGWDNFIIAPKGYNANYCEGHCHVSKFSKFLKQSGQYREEDVDSYRYSCCAPTKMRPLTILYMNAEGNIFQTIVPNMIVDECACV